MKVAVFGDLSGWATPFYLGLEKLKIDLTHEVIPSDLAIIQVGDLIHKGTDSNEIVAFMDRLITKNPGQVHQLLGNHEIEHLGGPAFYKCDCNEETLSTLRRWKKEGVAKMATSFSTLSGDVLVSHAGLTKEMWKSIGSPDEAFEAANRLNALMLENSERAFAAGALLRGYYTKHPVGVAWAIAGEEVYKSWVGSKKVPFNQVHGHTNVFNWYLNEWQDGVPQGDEGKVSRQKRHTYLTIGGKKFVGIDPGFGVKRPLPLTRPNYPLVSEGVVLD